MSLIDSLPTLQAQWEGFDRATIPERASSAQRKDMRTAFFAGALVILKPVLMVAELAGEDEAIAVMERYHMEVESFTDVLVLLASVLNNATKENDDD
jgi:hypothetical protein